MTTITACLRALILAAASATAVAAEQGPLARAVQPFVDQQRYAGAAIIVVTADKVLDTEAVGFADLANRKPMLPDSFGYIASTGKPITAAGIMMLVDEGKLRLEDPVARYLPEFAAKPTITVRMLLDNSSGLQGDVSPGARLYDSMPLPELVRDVASRPLLHEPGTSFVYSGIGDAVAGRVVEVVSKQGVENFFEQRLFKPLGMRDTTFFPSDAQLARLATSYWTPPGATQMTVAPLAMLTQPLGDRTHRYAPSCGLFSTAPDLARFAQLFLNGGTFGGKRYLSKASIDAMTRRSLGDEAQKHVPQPPGMNVVFSYGLGWGLTDDGAYFHPGLGGSDMAIDKTRHIAVVLMAQSGTDAAFRVRTAVIDAANQLFVQSRGPDGRWR